MEDFMTPDTGSYANVPDFVYGVTREIWEDRGIGGKLDRHYAPNCLVRAATGLAADNKDVTAQTLATLHQFPNRQLVGEDVIWIDNGDGSFLSSHRLTSVMRHEGDGIYGAATGRIVKSRIIADCVFRDQQMSEEWLVRDQAAFARCMGVTPRDMARDICDRDLRTRGEITFYTPQRDLPGSYVPPHHDDPELDTYRDGWKHIWDVKETSAIRDLYFHGAAVGVPGGHTLFGHAEYDRLVIGYLSSFPDARFEFQSSIVNRDPGRPTRVATRWSLAGTHGGFGHFGEPTGAPVYVMGLSHAELVDGQVRYEWTVTDEVSIWKQIHAHAESRAGA
jgi:predicted ester cyclase